MSTNIACTSGIATPYKFNVITGTEKKVQNVLLFKHTFSTVLPSHNSLSSSASSSFICQRQAQTDER